MKKLLAILGSVSLVTTAGMGVVACSNGGSVVPPGPIEPPTGGKEEINKLIKQLETEVSNNWTSEVTSPMAESATILDVEATNNNFTFLEKTNLYNVYNRASKQTRSEEQDPISFYQILTEDEKRELQNNIESLLSPALKSRNLKKSISASTYQAILAPLGTGWMENIKMDYQSALLNYTDIDNSFIANIEIGYSMKYSYMDAEDTQQTKTLRGNVSITIADDKVIIDAIKQVETQLAGDLLKSGSDLVWIDQETLKIDPAEIVGGKTEQYNVALEEYYKTLAKKTTTEIQKIFANSESTVMQATKVKLEDENDVIRNNSKVNQIGALEFDNSEIQSIHPSFESRKPSSEDIARQKLYFGEFKNDTSIKLGDGKQATSSTLHGDIEKAFSPKQKKYEQDFKTRYDEFTKYSQAEESPKIDSLITTSVSYEQVTIKGISFSLNNGYSQKMNDVLFNLSVSVDTSSTNEGNVRGKTFAAYYNASATALKAFHAFYGTSPTDIYELKNLNRYQKGLLFYMTGRSEALMSDGSQFNIWDYWKNLDKSVSPFGDKLRPQYGTFNDALNLTAGNDPEVSKIKNEYFISKLLGTDSFSLAYDQRFTADPVNARSFTFDQPNENNQYELAKGIRAAGIADGTTYCYNALRLTISNDIFNISFSNVDQWFDAYGKKFTMIGRK